MPLRRADVLVVGAGIAGLSAAHAAMRAGRDVTIVDEEAHRASDLPIALVNPLRGRTGRLVADGVDGMRATFALIDALRAAGHPIEAGRGLHRPLIGVAPEAMTEGYWRSRLDGKLAFDWLDRAPASLGLVDAVPCLRLHEAGWVAPRTLLDALQAASGARVVVDRVTRIARDGDAFVVTLASGAPIAAASVLWCGGAWGAALLDRETPSRADDALYKPGSLLAVDARLVGAPLSFGLYAAPSGDGTVIGPTREGSGAVFPDHGLPSEALAHLADRIARVFGSTMPVREAWRGVRLTRLSSSAAATLGGIPHLTALGSRGFLVGPLQAARWARSL